MPTSSRHRLPGSIGLAIGLSFAIVMSIAVAGALFGREPGPAWLCDDTRYTQLVPPGRSVVGAPASPPPGCAP